MYSGGGLGFRQQAIVSLEHAMVWCVCPRGGVALEAGRFKLGVCFRVCVYVCVRTRMARRARRAHPWNAFRATAA